MLVMMTGCGPNEVPVVLLCVSGVFAISWFMFYFGMYAIIAGIVVLFLVCLLAEFLKKTDSNHNSW